MIHDDRDDVAEYRQVRIRSEATALTIAGSDPSGGAGLQADLKTFHQLGVYGTSVVTLLTVQNTTGVRYIEVMKPGLVLAQLQAVLEDIPPRAIKVGALGNAELVEAIGQALRDVDCPVVVDPVLVSKHGHSLVTDDVVEAYKEFLLPNAQLVTPNRFEAERLTGIRLNSETQVAEAIQSLLDLGVQNVLIKLGNVDGKAMHVLGMADGNRGISTQLLKAENIHGSGCVLAAAITARLAIGGVDMLEAVDFGIKRTHEALQVDSTLGKGIRPAEVRAMNAEAI